MILLYLVDEGSHISRYAVCSREVAYIFSNVVALCSFHFAIRRFHSTVFGLQFDVLGEDFYFFLSVSAEHFVFFVCF